MNAPAAIVAAAINARLSPDLRRRLAAHAGSSVALQLGFLRLCFRILSDGRWRAASSLIEADAEMRADGGGMSVRGDGGLLRDLDEVRQQCSPMTVAEEMLGADGATCFRDAAEKMSAEIRELPVRLGVAASAAEVSDFVKKAAAFDGKVAAAESRLLRLAAAQTEERK